MAGSDKNHWAVINPTHGFIPEWDVNESARIRMVPNTQVAGVAMVTDAVVTIKMLIKEGLAPLLTNIGQIQALAGAYKEVEENGIRLGVYANWFLDGHPTGVTRHSFNQKDAAYASLVGELGIVATKYYEGTTISKSASLANAAQQLGEDSARTVWTALGRQKSSLSAQQITRIYARVKGASTSGTILGLLSAEDTEITTAVDGYNSANVAAAKVMDVATAATVDIETIKANAASADAFARVIMGGTA
jgi:hypothetical protein